MTNPHHRPLSDATAHDRPKLFANHSHVSSSSQRNWRKSLANGHMQRQNGQGPQSSLLRAIVRIGLGSCCGALVVKRPAFRQSASLCAGFADAFVERYCVGVVAFFVGFCARYDMVDGEFVSFGGLGGVPANVHLSISVVDEPNIQPNWTLVKG